MVRIEGMATLLQGSICTISLDCSELLMPHFRGSDWRSSLVVLPQKQINIPTHSEARRNMIYSILTRPELILGLSYIIYAPATPITSVWRINLSPVCCYSTTQPPPPQCHHVNVQLFSVLHHTSNLVISISQLQICSARAELIQCPPRLQLRVAYSIQKGGMHHPHKRFCIFTYLAIISFHLSHCV